MGIYINGIETLNELHLTNNLTLSGTCKLANVLKTTTYTTNDDVFIGCDASDSTFTITLTPAATSNGLIYVINKVDATANVVTIDGDGSDLIDGELTQTLTTQFDVIKLRCDGTRWYTW